MRGEWLARGGFAHFVVHGETNALCGVSASVMLPAGTRVQCSRCAKAVREWDASVLLRAHLDVRVSEKPLLSKQGGAGVAYRASDDVGVRPEDTVGQADYLVTDMDGRRALILNVDPEPGRHDGAVRWAQEHGWTYLAIDPADDDREIVDAVRRALG